MREGWISVVLERPEEDGGIVVKVDFLILKPSRIATHLVGGLERGREGGRQ